MSDNTNSLFPTRTMFNAIGCLLKQPMLLQGGKVKLERHDMMARKQSKFHAIIFATIENLIDKGLTTIQPSDVDDYLSRYPDHYEIFNSNDGIEWCYSAIENAKVENYEVFVGEIKKYSLLRELQAEGFNVSEIYPLESDDDNLRGQFDKMDIDDILKYYENKINKVSSSYHVGYDRQKSKAGDNGVELLESFKQAPMYGFSTIGKMQNTIMRGALPKTSMLRSAGTNIGKCVTGDSLVLTDKGMIEIDKVPNYYNLEEDNKLNAKVMSYNDVLQRVTSETSHWYNMGTQDTIKVTTENGYTVEGTHEHPVMIERRGESQWCKLSELQPYDKLVMGLDTQMFGDVNMSRMSSYRAGTQIEYSEVEYSIPNKILLGNKQVVRAYLQGVYDTLGSYKLETEIVEQIKEYDLRLTLTHTSEKFIKQLQIMLLNLGILSTRENKLLRDKVYAQLNITNILDLNKFYYEIGATMQNGIIKKAIEKYVRPVSHIDDVRYRKETLSDTILNIKQYKNVVYDFTVPDTHCFVANGVIVHNTRIAIAEATDFAIDSWYIPNLKNPQEGEWVKKDKKRKVLFISTEMEEDELQPTMWAYVSGVAEEKIVDGNLTEREEQLVKEAIEHLKECELYIEYVPKFDPQTINTIIKEYAIRHDIDVVFFDYIHLSFEIMMDISSKTRGMTMREDMMLTIFASGLEELAREYNFHLRTSTQINGEQVEQSSQMLDQRLLRGAKAMADKMQYGVIMTKPTPKELQLVEYHKRLLGAAYGDNTVPNMVYHFYKNRKTKYKGKQWLHIDYSTMRITELFFTDFQNNQIEIPLTELSDDTDR